MPKLLDRLKNSLMEKQNLQEGNAIALAKSILEKNGYMKNGKLTARGKLKQKVKEGVKGIPKKK